MNYYTVFKLLFYLACFVLAGILGLKQYLAYLKNEDSTSMTYRRFNEEQHDAYPTYTICIKSLYGDIFRKEDFLGIPGDVYKNSLVYNHVLLGKCCKNATIVEIASKKSYDEILSSDISRFVIDKTTITREGDEINSWSNETNEINELKELFYRSYQDPNMVCLTNKAHFKPNLILKRDFINLDAVKMNEELFTTYEMFIEFFIHQPDASISKLHDPILRIDQMQLQYIQNTSRMINIRINQVDVLEKREDAIVQCNASLTELDQMYRLSVINYIGCIPSYWKQFYQEKKEHLLPGCNAKKQYEILSEFMPIYFENGTKLFMPNCRHMTVTFDMAQADVSYSQGKIGFTLNYGSESYKYFKNIRSFSIYDFWSQVGGFVGMLLGYSLLQVPDICIALIQMIAKNFSKKSFKTGTDKFFARNNTTFKTKFQLELPKYHEPKEGIEINLEYPRNEKIINQENQIRY